MRSRWGPARALGRWESQGKQDQRMTLFSRMGFANNIRPVCSSIITHHVSIEVESCFQQPFVNWHHLSIDSLLFLRIL